MARNSGGTETLPAGNPVVTGTPITSTWANNTMGDIATEITNSLDRNGRGGMLAPLRTVDGTLAAPAQSFTSETGSGWFRNAAGDLRLAVLGVLRITANAVGALINGTFTVSGASTLTGAVGLGANLTFTAGNQVATSAANASLTVAGNRTGADTGADVVVNSTATRTAGSLIEGQNNTVAKFRVDFNGEPSLASGLACGAGFKTDADQVDSVGSVTNVTGMSFPVAANGIYAWETVGFGRNTGALSQLLVRFSGPAAATAVYYSQQAGTVASAFAADVSVGTAGGNLVPVLMSGTLVNGANAGTVQMQFSWNAQGTSATIFKGMQLRWRQLG